ncbi:MAG: hypothetical protein M5R36_01315 [Deltaproteobacteria bacterium]|nr:hypothetical protein [Deltaproteobacteria bacterium]
MSWAGLVRDLREPPKHILKENLIADGNFDQGMFQAYWAKAAQKLTDTQKAAGELYDEKKKAMDEFVVTTKEQAKTLALMTKGPVKIKD